MRNVLNKKSALIFFIFVFSFTLTEAVLVREVVLPKLLSSLHAGSGFIVGGDSIGYHEYAVIVANKINIEGWSVWELRPGTDVITLATPVGIASVIYALFGPNPIYLLPINALIHASAALLFLMMMQAVFQNRLVAKIATLPFVIFPTAIFWTSQLLKDGIYILGMYAYLYSWVLLSSYKVQSYRSLVFLVVFSTMGVLLVGIVRTYTLPILAMNSVILGAVLVIWKYKNKGKYKEITKKIIFTVCIVIINLLIISNDKRPSMVNWSENVNNESVYLGGRVLSPYIELNGDGKSNQIQSLKRCEGWVDSEYIPTRLSTLAARVVTIRNGYYDNVYVSAGSTLDREVCITSFNELIAYIPRALHIGLMGPFPNQWFNIKSHGNGISRLLVGAEMLIIYISLFAIIFLGRLILRKPELCMIIFFSVVMILILSLVTPNLGALHRMRYGFIMLITGVGFGLLAKQFLSKLNITK